MEPLLQGIPKIDTHVHLGDVCGIGSVHRASLKKSKIGDNLLASTNYNRWLSHLISSSFFPKTYLKRAIADLQTDNIEQLKISMAQQSVQKCWLLPIEPYVTSNDLFSWVGSASKDKVAIMAGINFETCDTHEKILKSLNDQKKNFKCHGIKFHPNIQNIDPLSDKARFLYEVADQLGMFLIIHGGCTPFLSGLRKKLARVRNFYAIFSNYKNLKVIFAHIGQYFDYDLQIIKDLCRRPNFYVDTSGVSPNTVFYALRHFDSERILFGTDWPFCSHRQAVKILDKAIKKHANSSAKQKELFHKIFSRNATVLMKETL